MSSIYALFPTRLALVPAALVLLLSCGGGSGEPQANALAEVPTALVETSGGASDSAADGVSAPDGSAAGTLVADATLATVPPILAPAAPATSGVAPASSALVSAAVVLDKLSFGDAASETSHGMGTRFGAAVAAIAPLPSITSAGPASDVVTGVAGQRARRLLARKPDADYYGGELTFTMSVDPVAQNYFTAKVNGSDAASSWLLLNVDGYEVGSRHGGDTDEELFLNHGGWFSQRFVYRTVRLPWHLTRGRTQVTIKLRALGSISYYAISSYNAYQQRMQAPTPGVYAVYTHTGKQPDLSGETQGSAPATQSPRAAASDAVFIANWKTSVDANVNRVLSTAASSLAGFQVQFAAEAYSQPWSLAYRNPAVISKAIDTFDAMATAYSASPTTYAPASGGGGCTQWALNFGEIGTAVVRLWDSGNAATWSTALDATVAYGGSLGTSTRRVAWSKVLRATVDQGRFNRKTISNQQMMSDWCVYISNRALLLIDPPRALLEAEARRYLYEAVGMTPWRGSDQPGGGPTPVRGTGPWGPNAYAATSSGTTKESCLVGGDYGEVGTWVFDWAEFIGDASLRARALQMLRARAALRYPTNDANGYLTSVAVEPIGCRNDHEINGHVVYLGRANHGDLRVAAAGAAVVGTDLLGYLQQQVTEGQLQAQLSANNSPSFNAYWRLVGSSYVPDLYTAFRAQPPTGVRLPMSSGMPDFAWGDEENMAVAAKHGEERFWAVLNWHGATGINRLAKVFALTPQTARLAEVSVDDVQYEPSGRWAVGAGLVEMFAALTPPDQPVAASRSVVWPMALQPDGNLPIRAGDGGRGSAYTLRYGAWLVAINAHPSRPYTVRTPAGFAGGVDLVSQASFGATVTLAPKTTAVFYLPDSVEVPAPATVLAPRALGANQRALVAWDATPGAATYVLRRSTTRGGPYATIATGVTATSYVDATVANGTTYYYLVAGVGPSGVQGPAGPEVSAQPMTSSLPVPWFNADVGPVTLVGSAAQTAGVFTLTASGADMWGTSDQFQWAAQPLAGDGSITARVLDQSSTHPWSKVGVMLREGLSSSDRHVAMIITPGNGAQMVYRASTGGRSVAAGALAGAHAPHWVRLVRTGQRMTGYTSADGLAWSSVGSVTLPMGAAAFAGLVVSSHNAATLSTTHFDNVSLTSSP